jgi:hypothetical protein
MGVRGFGSSNGFIGAVVDTNPNPKNFKVLLVNKVGKNLVVKIKYHDCINYDGVKLLVYKDLTIDKLSDLKVIDPHFLERTGVYPFARFEPTEDGYKLAIKLAKLI